MDVSAFTSSAYYASYSPQSYRFLYVLDWCHYFPLMSFIWFYCMIKHYIASPVQGVSMLTWAVAVYTVKCWLNSFLHWEEKKMLHVRLVTTSIISWMSPLYDRHGYDILLMCLSYDYFSILKQHYVFYVIWLQCNITVVNTNPWFL